jgi:hypothetical protein
MEKYCGFIEVWGVSGETKNTHCPFKINELENALMYTEKCGLITVAIFKIKLK